MSVEPKRWIVVTGAASGIGAGCVSTFARSGWSVIGVDRDAEALEAICAEHGAEAATCDVGQLDALRQCFAEIDAMVGDDGLSALVNNAGVGNLKALEAYTANEYELIMRVNLDAVFFGLQLAKPLLDRALRPAVVNVSSLAGVRPTFGESPYCAAKAAVLALTQSAAREWAPHIRVNAVSPGFVATPLNQIVRDQPEWLAGVEERTPAGRVGAVDEVVGAIAFLLSEAAGYVTGQNLIIDGGSSLVSAQTDTLLRSFLGR